jgi:chorismate mutase
MLAMLSRRMQVCRKIAQVKRDEDLPLLQMDRWREVLSTAVRHGGELGLDSRFVAALMQLVHEASLEVQAEELRKKEGNPVR